MPTNAGLPTNAPDNATDTPMDWRDHIDEARDWAHMASEFCHYDLKVQRNTRESRIRKAIAHLEEALKEVER